MTQSLLLLRLLGALVGVLVMAQGFIRFRQRGIPRRDFFLRALIGLAIVVVAVAPDSINVVAAMLSLREQQFGRIIALLVLSNLGLLVLVLGGRTRADAMSRQIQDLARAAVRTRFLAEEERPRSRSVWAVLPALNEADNLERLLPRFPKEVCGRALGVVVVDDGSMDGTADVVRKHGFAAAVNPTRSGGGAALRVGYDIARLNGAEVIVTMDADGQHLPEEIERLVGPILLDEADIVIGSRLLGEHERDSWVRWAGIYAFNALIAALTGTRVTDCSNGFRAFHVAALERVVLRQDQFHTAELIIDAARKGLRISEAPITVKRRDFGESKKGKNLSYGFNFSKTIFKTWLRD